MDKVSEFLKSAEDAGIDKGDIPDLSKAPNSLLEALETHLQSLEKGKSTLPPDRPVTIPAFNVEQWYMKNEKWMEPPAPVEPPITSPTVSLPSPSMDDMVKEDDDYLTQQKKLLDMFERGKVEEQQKQLPLEVTPQIPSDISPELSLPIQINSHTIAPTIEVAANDGVDDLSKPSDDLLCLSAPAVSPMQNSSFPMNAFSPSNTDIFGSSTYSSSFNNTPTDSYNPFLQMTTHSSSTPNLLDDVLVPETQVGGVTGASTPSVNSSHENQLPTDVNKGLERVALSLDGLNINPATLKVNTSKGHQWNPSTQNHLKTGGANYQMTPVRGSTMPPVRYSPMAQPPMFGQYGSAGQQPFYPNPPPGMYQPMPAQPAMFGANFGYGQTIPMNSNPLESDNPFK